MIASCTRRSVFGISPAALRFWSSKGQQKWQPVLPARIPCWNTDLGEVRRRLATPIAHAPVASSIRRESEPHRSRSMSGSLARWKGNGNHAESKEKAKRKIGGNGDKKKRKASNSVMHGSSNTVNYPVGFGDIFLGPWTEQLRQAVQLASVKMDTLTSLKHINTTKMLLHFWNSFVPELHQACSIYDPPTGTRLVLPFGRYRYGIVMRLATAYIYWIGTKPIDKRFVQTFTVLFPDIYRCIRQVTSNVREGERVDLLREYVSQELLQAVKSNLTEMPEGVEKDKGVEVHDVRCKVVGLHFADKPGLERIGIMTVPRIDAEAREWLQVHVGVAALERDTIISGGQVIARSDLKFRSSTWIFEGELVKGNRGEGRAGQWRLLRIVE